MLENACYTYFTSVFKFLMLPPLEMKMFLEVTCHSVDTYPLLLPVKRNARAFRQEQNNTHGLMITKRVVYLGILCVITA